MILVGKNAFTVLVLGMFGLSSCSDVTVVTPANIDNVIDGSKNVLLEFYAPWCGHCQHLEPHYDEVAKHFKSKPEIVIAKVDADMYQALGQKFGITGFPSLKWFPMGSTASTEDYTGMRVRDDIVRFVESRATQTPGKGKKASPTTVLTAANFDRVVDGSKHVLVEFYAPWCGHCKTLEPHYDKLAKAYAPLSDEIVIAKVDAEEHRALGQVWGVKGYPQVMLFKRGAPRSPVDYSSYRTAAALTEFLKEQTGLAPAEDPDAAEDKAGGGRRKRPSDDDDGWTADYDEIIAEHFRAGDADGDGYLSRAEARALVGELAAAEAGAEEPDAARVKKEVDKMFAEQDIDGDKRISLYEFKTAGH